MGLATAFRWNSLRKKLLVTFLCLGLIPIVVIGMLAYARSRDSLIAAAGQAMQVHARNAADTIDRCLSERAREVSAFTHNPLLQGSPEEATAAANLFVRTCGSYDLVVVADSDGRVIAANTSGAGGRSVDSAPLIGRSVRGEDWFEKVTGGATGSGGVHCADLAVDQWVAEACNNRGHALAFSAAIHDENGRIARVWSARCSFDRTVGRIMEDVRSSLRGLGVTTAETQILARSGLILEDGDPHAVLSSNLVNAGLEAARLALDGKAGTTQEVHERRKIEQLNGYARAKGVAGFAGHGWGVLVRQDLAEAFAGARRLRAFFLAIGIVALIGITVIAVWIADSIVRPIRRAVGVLEGVAKGDLTRSLPASGYDEVGRMASAVNEAVAGMRQTLRDVSAAASQTAAASQELSAAAGQLSSGAQEQAAALEETAASLEEITATVKQTADHASQANQFSVGSRSAAEKGGSVVAAAIDSMGEISEASKKIADIITTIDEIAFQTNLLALNAAVEAARAGDHGRGFAVVAAEVRNLAQRSAGAAKEIKNLIQDSLHKVNVGCEHVNKSGETLDEIVTSVKRVTDIVGEIAAASQEQSSGIDQVNRAIAQMDQVIQSNAGQTEELSSTAQSLAFQARQLQALVSRFKLGVLEHGALPMPAGATARPNATARPPVNRVQAVAKPKAPVPGTPPARAAVNALALPGPPSTPTASAARSDGGSAEFEEF
jgi:methyl-accepting chemotaxis protein